MTLYEYRCERHGLFDADHPLGTAPESMPCPDCTDAARRVFSKPLLSFAPRALVAALEHEEKTSSEPDVVTSLPPRPRHKRTPVLPLTPTLRRLPRP